MASRLRHHIALVAGLCWYSSLFRLSLAVANLDTIEPILRKSPESTVLEDSFGYSVVLHQVEEPVIGDFDSFINNTRIIVGAPHGTYPGGLEGLPELTPLNSTGLVYQCTLQVPGSCERIGSSSDPTSNDRRLFDGDPNMPMDMGTLKINEDKSQQLMGSVLASNNEFFVACAPRWIVIPDGIDLDNRRAVGRCFFSPRNLSGFELLMPCSGLTNVSPQSNSDNCLSGFSANIADQSQSGEATVVLGVLGDSLFRGNLILYDVTSDPTMITSSIKTRVDINLGSVILDGYSLTTGFINNPRSSGIPDYISGVPRYDGNTLSGLVRVRSRVTLQDIPLLSNIAGKQTGEYFGFSVVAIDLNNDGYDDLAVGAPIFSDTISPEMGRVYIYENIGGALNDTPIILDGNMVPLARFGYSMVNLGDINGDGFEDIAIGAPYEPSSGENTGAVYIYYGATSELGLISRSPNQVLNSQDIVQRLSSVGLTSLKTFGFSLASDVDVDGNEVNDLLVGAEESKAAILFRSLSVAYITFDVSTDTDIIQLDTTDNIGSTFTLRVCASYNGRGLDGRPLTTPLNVSEAVSSNIPRIYFSNNQSSILTEFVFNTTNSIHCLDIPVFVKAVSDLITGQVDLRAPLELIVRFPPIPRREPDFNSLLDYREIPILIDDGNRTVSVEPSVNCSRDMAMQEVCNPDLTVTLRNVSFRDSLNNSSPQVIAGSTQTAVIDLEYSNIGEDPAFGSQITFTLPERFTFIRVDVASDALPINCQPSGDTNDRLFRCDLPNYVPPLRSTQAPRISLIWRLSETIVGDESNDISNISILLTQSSSSSDVEIDDGNNALINGPVIIKYTAIADIAISSFLFTASPSTYRGQPPEEENPNFAQIGQRVVLVLSAVNRGPSVSPNVLLNIYLPTNNTDNLFYIYPFAITSTLSSSGRGSISCNQRPFNPQGLAPPPSGIINLRRKRSVKNTRQSSDTTTTPTPLTKDGIEILTETRNCSSTDEGCTHVQCNITNFLRAVTTRITITAALDERFFVNQINNFIFEARATIENVKEFIQDVNSTNDQSRTKFRVVLFMEPESQNFPIWIPIVCGVIAVIVIISLFVLLYFVGFFRRKKREEEDKEVEGDYDVQSQQIPANVKADLDNIDEKKPNLSPEKIVHSPSTDDIGNADDLQDGEIDAPEKDPEETSL